MASFSSMQSVFLVSENTTVIVNESLNVLLFSASACRGVLSSSSSSVFQYTSVFWQISRIFRDSTRHRKTQTSDFPARIQHGDELYSKQARKAETRVFFFSGHLFDFPPDGRDDLVDLAVLDIFARDHVARPSSLFARRNMTS